MTRQARQARQCLKLWGIVSSVWAALLPPWPARAQEAPLPQVAHPSPPPSANTGSAGNEAATTTVQITAKQFDAFVELVGEARSVVWQHLVADPDLVPLAIAAAEARTDRRSSGKARTIVGFTIAGVGEAAGFVALLSAMGDTNNCGNDTPSYGSCGGIFGGHAAAIGLAIMAVATGVGLAIGIPGIISIAKQSDAENAAVDRYQGPQAPAPPPAYFPTQSTLPSVKSLKVPLLSFAF